MCYNRTIMLLEKLGVLLPLTLEWALTKACNMRCAYCSAKKPRYVDTDFSDALERVIALAPKTVWLGGGEPTLVRQLPLIARTLRQSIDPHLSVNTNLTNTELLFETLPFVDDLVISIDTLDDGLCKKYRGISSRETLANIRETAYFIRRNNLKVNLAVNSVVYRESLAGPGISELNDALWDIDRDFTHTFSPVYPASDPLSIIGDKKYSRMLFGIVDSLKEKGRRVSVQLASNLSRHARASGKDPFTARGGKCFRRYFRLHLTGNGKFYSNCPPADPEDARCAQFCNCAEFIDNLLFLKAGQAADDPFFNGKFTRFETAMLGAFVRQYIEPGLGRDAYKKLLKR